MELYNNQILVTDDGLEKVSHSKETLPDSGVPRLFDDHVGQHFLFQIYQTSPANWLKRLERTGLAFVVSPQIRTGISHTNVIVSWDHPVTYRVARELCKMLCCPAPEVVIDPLAAYRAHIGAYSLHPEIYNGWEIALSQEQTAVILTEIFDMITERSPISISELLGICTEAGVEYVQVAGMNLIPISMYMRVFEECSNEGD